MFNISRKRAPKAAERSGVALGDPSLRDCNALIIQFINM